MNILPFCFLGRFGHQGSTYILNFFCVIFASQNGNCIYEYIPRCLHSAKMSKPERIYAPIHMWQWGAGNVCPLVLSENPIAIMGCRYVWAKQD